MNLEGQANPSNGNYFREESDRCNQTFANAVYFLRVARIPSAFRFTGEGIGTDVGDLMTNGHASGSSHFPFGESPFPRSEAVVPWFCWQQFWQREVPGRGADSCVTGGNEVVGAIEV